MSRQDYDTLDLKDFDSKLFQDSPLRLCSYLPDRASQLTFMLLESDQSIDASLYQDLSISGFRRSGDAFYRPNCRHCMQCISSRIITSDFVPSRRFRKVLNRNKHVSISLLSATNTSAEHYHLYQRYISARHADGDMYPPSLHTFEQFLLKSPAHTLFMEVRDLYSKLIAVAVTDVLNNGLSSIYTFFDPSELYRTRSLGVLSILKQIQVAQFLGLDYVYLGYWIPSVQKMSYKTDYTPIELLINGEWTRFEDTPNKETIIKLLATFPATSYL